MHKYVKNVLNAEKANKINDFIKKKNINVPVLLN